MTGLRSPYEYERYWAQAYVAERVFEADPDPSRPKVLITFPYSYQNGPLHVGHLYTASRADAYARYKRLKGYNVLFPWAWHWTGEAVAGISDRLRKGDQNLIRILREVDGVPEEVIGRFVDPVEVCRHYTSENREAVKAIGFSVDWRREFHTTDLHPYYSRFVRWQYLTLERLGRVRRGSHPVVWCPKCQSPTGDHDRMVGEGVGPTEFTSVLFELDGVYLAAATLRPETVFGTTNVWVRPDVEYAVVEVDGKRVVLSREAAFKLSEQIEGVREVGSVRGRDLIGKAVKVPLTGASVPVLPAEFVRTDLGTGIVYSVPAHAPYDYAALRDLKRDPAKLEAFGIGRDVVERIEPISIATTEGLGSMPAVELVEGRGIKDQNDTALEELTSFVYSEEFYKGRMNENCGELAGIPVREARDLIKDRLRSMGLAFPFYDLTERVVCRSGDECIVKVVRDQWFLTYSDEDWKEMVRDCVRSMNVHPEGVRQWFLNVVDWLRDWPCARKTGLGTRLPFDEEWIVETLSDSTVYMALYTISHFVNSGKVTPDQLTYEVLDYVFRGNGDPEAVARSVGMDPEALRGMRREFEYWYPVDLRFSAKDLVPNHLTFFVFQHVAIFDRSKWPRGVSVNGIVRVEGEEMHKTRGNFIPIKVAISKYGADASRLALLLAAEDMDDPDWREKNAIEYRRTLDHILRIAQEVSSTEPDGAVRRADRWLLAELRRILRTIEEAMEETKTRTAANAAVYLMLNAWRRYLRRRGGPIGPAARTFLRAWAVVLSPFAPFTAEEVNRIMGGQGFVARASWPVVEGEGLEEVLVEEEVLDSLVEDVKSIVRVTGAQPNRVRILVAPRNSLEIFTGILDEVAARGSVDIGRWVRSFPQEVDRAAAASLVRRFAELARALLQKHPLEALKAAVTSERSLYEEEAEFLRRELGLEVEVTEADYARPDPLRKALQAVPLKPGVIVS